MDVTPGSDQALFLKGNTLYVTALPKSKATLTDAVDLSDMVATIDYPQEWAQIFDEAWRAYRDGFYLEICTA